MRLDISFKNVFMKKAWNIFKGIVWGAIIIAALFIIVTSFNFLGFQMFIVKSGSMEPIIQTGSVVIDKKETNYNIGNIITFKNGDKNDTTTHRIVAMGTQSGSTYYIVKGDANNAPDPNRVPKTNVVGKEQFSIPYLGYIINSVRTLPGLIILIFIPAIIIISEEISNIKLEVSKLYATRKKVVKEVEKLEEVIERGEKKITKRIIKKSPMKARATK
jgi:signal peptidase